MPLGPHTKCFRTCYNAALVARKQTGGPVLQRFLKEKALNVGIPAELHRAVDVHCAQQGITIKAFTIAALTEKLADEQQAQTET